MTRNMYYINVALSVTEIQNIEGETILLTKLNSNKEVDEWRDYRINRGWNNPIAPTSRKNQMRRREWNKFIGPNNYVREGRKEL